jgi:hypothetical protein
MIKGDVVAEWGAIESYQATGNYLGSGNSTTPRLLEKHAEDLQEMQKSDTTRTIDGTRAERGGSSQPLGIASGWE